MKTILVPVDFSDITPGVMDAAVRLAHLLEARLLLLHAVSSRSFTATYATTYPLAVASDKESLLKRRKEALARLEELAEEPRGREVPVDTRVSEGRAVYSILEASRNETPEMIILGSHGHDSSFGLAVGSTAKGVLKCAECPVLIVPARPRTARKQGSRAAAGRPILTQYHTVATRVRSD